ncbi:MAG TPA: hypothetical protein P5056_02205, partial [Candidatus Paceibacterota bacterium]|nr:hypothetical protein [Candidatus Paceibacterota bacterium]
MKNKFLKINFSKFKNFISACISILCVASFVAPNIVFAADTYFDGGDGSPETPYQISTCAQLQDIGTTTEGFDPALNTLNYVLTANIDCTGTEVEGSNFIPIASFSGDFNGGGYTISNITSTYNVTNSGAGLFSSILYPANIHDLTIASSVFVPTSSGVYPVYSGAVAAQMFGGTIDHVNVLSSVTLSGGENPEVSRDGTGATGGLVG